MPQPLPAIAQEQENGPETGDAAAPLAISALGTWIEPVHCDILCEEVYERFSAAPDLFVLPVVDGGTPIGLVNRQLFLVRLADRFGRALFGQKPITRLMDDNPLIVRDDMTVEELGTIIVETRPGALLDGFLVTHDGAYCGVGTALSLLTLTLEQARHRNRMLEEARARAETSNRSKTQFLANMSHELRTPLNAIIGFSQILSSEMFGPLGHNRYRDYARDIGDSGTHLLAIINDILDIAKVEAGKLELTDECINVGAVMNSAIRFVRERARQMGIQLLCAAPPRGFELRGDGRLVKQILLNLLTNAIKFSSNKGVVSLGAQLLADGTLRFTVKDQGIGMTAADIGKALEPFGQVANHLSRSHQGAGLGLPLVKRMTEAHGGTLAIESTPGVGTSVTVTFPAGRVRAGGGGRTTGGTDGLSAAENRPS